MRLPTKISKLKLTNVKIAIPPPSFLANLAFAKKSVNFYGHGKRETHASANYQIPPFQGIPRSIMALGRRSRALAEPPLCGLHGMGRALRARLGAGRPHHQ